MRTAFVLSCVAISLVGCGSSDESRQATGDAGATGGGSSQGDGSIHGSGGHSGTGGATTGTGGATTGTGGGGTGGAGTGGIAGSGGIPDSGSTASSDAGPDGSLDGSAPVSRDAGADGSDASSAADASNGCSLGSASSLGTDQNLNLFGTPVYFAGGADLPAGRYRVTYVDGCMKYASTQDWTIHAYANGQNAAWWLVGATSDVRIVIPPGTAGYSSSNGAFTDFDACVAANLALPPVDFDFTGGKLGVWLLDSPYSDNLSGLNGRNPKWKLDRLGGVCGDGG